MRNDISVDNIIKLYDKISTSEQHFNTLQLEYRKLSSIWLLAMFGGVGFLLIKVSEAELNTRIVLIGLISLGGALGICLIWLLDLVVYHRLLRAYFLTGLMLEKQYSEYLPPTRSIMRHLDSHKKQILNHIVLYYFLTSLVCLVISLAAFNSLVGVRVNFLNVGYFHSEYWLGGTAVLMTVVYSYLFYTTVFQEQIKKEISNFKFDVNAIVKPRPVNTEVRRVVITGGPGSGKTTFIEALRKEGYPVVPESALFIIDQLNAMLGTDRQKDWRTVNKNVFQEYICKLGRLQEEIMQSVITNLQTAYKEKVVFFDRGLFDGAAYYPEGDPLPSFLNHVFYDFSYDAVFVMDTPRDFKPREETGRKTATYEESQKMGDRHFEIYQKHFAGRVFRVSEGIDRKEQIFSKLQELRILS